VKRVVDHSGFTLVVSNIIGQTYIHANNLWNEFGSLFPIKTKMIRFT
jgi:hypothetical protein